MSEPISAISCISNVFIRQMTFVKAGDVELGHSHCFDHVTLLSAGRLRVEALGTSTDFTAPQHIFIKAGVLHRLIALEDNTIAQCIHALRDGDRVEDIVDPASLPQYIHHAYPEGVKPLTVD